MKAKLIAICCMLVLVGAAQAQTSHPQQKRPRSHWTDENKKVLVLHFNTLWQTALDQGLVPSGEIRPEIVTAQAEETLDCLSTAAFADKRTLTFCTHFLEGDKTWQWFAIAHEIVHVILRHKAQFEEVGEKSPKEAWETVTRCECEANVLAGTLTSVPFTLSVLKRGLDLHHPDLADVRSIEVLQGKRKTCRE